MTGSRLFLALTLGFAISECDTQHVVVGDPATQAERLGDIGFGATVMLEGKD
jgi:hypothetical protein